MIEELGKGRARFYVSIGGREDRKRFSKTVTYKTKRELKALYDEFEGECKAKMNTADITVKDLLKSYIEYCKMLNRKQTTVRGYEIAAERLYSSVGAIKARSLTTYQLEKIVAQMSADGSSGKTIKNSISLLSAAYRHVVRLGQLTDNPCDRLVLPKVTPKDIRILHQDEIRDFVIALQDEPLDDKVAFELALFLGLRRSEILGLKESDVDIVSGIISIHNTRHRVDGEDIDTDTKTKRSTRVLALPDILLIDIAKLLQVHRDFKYEKVDYLIQDGFGGAILPQTLASRLARFEKRKNLPSVTLHGLRHTYASLLHSSGVDMAAVSANLGHSNLSTTANIYTHIFKTPTQASRGIANTINNFEIPCQIGDKSEKEKTSER